MGKHAQETGQPLGLGTIRSKSNLKKKVANGGRPRTGVARRGYEIFHVLSLAPFFGVCSINRLPDERGMGGESCGRACDRHGQLPRRIRQTDEDPSI